MEKCIIDLLDTYGNINVICSGNFNARTGNLQTNPCFQYEDDGEEVFIASRFSQDAVVNDFGKKLLGMCACSDLEILTGCENLGPLVISRSVRSCVVDYFLTKYNFSVYVEKLSVKDRIDSDQSTCLSKCIVMLKQEVMQL